MKGIIVTIFAIAITTMSALAIAGGWGWKYYAESPSAWGYGVAYNAASAKQRALVECARRTPTWETCYITGREQIWID